MATDGIDQAGQTYDNGELPFEFKLTGDDEGNPIYMYNKITETYSDIVATQNPSVYIDVYVAFNITRQY